MFFGGSEEVEVWSCVGEGEGVRVGVMLVMVIGGIRFCYRCCCKGW